MAEEPRFEVWYMPPSLNPSGALLEAAYASFDGARLYAETLQRELGGRYIIADNHLPDGRDLRGGRRAAARRVWRSWSEPTDR